jgi:hypothetical protein
MGRSMQCNVEFGYQLIICSGTKESHGKPSSSWPVAGPSGCKLTSSEPATSCFLQYFYVRTIWISTISFITPAEGMNAYMSKYAYKYTSVNLGVYCSLEKSDVVRGLLLRLAS